MSNMYLGTNFKQGDKVKMVYVKRVEGIPQSTDVICFADKPPSGIVIDWNKMFQKTVIDKIEDILKIIGVEWHGTKAQKTITLRKWFE